MNEVQGLPYSLINIGIALAVWLWSTRIGDDAAMPPAPAAPEQSVAKATARGDTAPRGASMKRPLLPVADGAGLDRKAFILAFQRQASLQLVACLKAWDMSPGSIAVTATLNSQGQLRHVVSLDPTRSLPDCAVEAAEAMDFKAIGRRLQRPTVVVQWRIDW